MNYTQLLKARDKRESKLNSLKHQSALHEEQKVRMQELFEKELAAYQEWKTVNKIEGLIF